MSQSSVTIFCQVAGAALFMANYAKRLNNAHELPLIASMHIASGIGPDFKVSYDLTIVYHTGISHHECRAFEERLIGARDGFEFASMGETLSFGIFKGPGLQPFQDVPAPGSTLVLIPPPTQEK